MTRKDQELRELITSKGPQFGMPTFVMGDPDSVKFSTMTDGTTTVVQISLLGTPIGTGVAKRHPKDARNQELGMALALTRAFTDAAAKYTYSLGVMLNPPPDPSLQSLRHMRGYIKKDKQRRKDIKRKAAREAHREIMGWDHTTRVGIKGWRPGE